MSSYWEVIAPAGIAAMSTVVYLAARLSRPSGAHRADPAGLQEVIPDVRDLTMPAAPVAGLPPWGPVGAECGPGSLGTWFPHDDPYGTEQVDDGLRDPMWDAVWSAADLAALHDAPTVLDDAPVTGRAGEAGWIPDSVSSEVMGERSPADGAGDESEACGPPAPPVPPWECPRCASLFEVPGFNHEPCWDLPLTRLLRTTGELLRADLLADACAFMARQDTETITWLADARERWAAA